jgi:hypothetical protein
MKPSRLFVFCLSFFVFFLTILGVKAAVNQLTNLPTLYINIKDSFAINKDGKSLKYKDLYLETVLQMTATDTTGLYNDTAQIKGRGNSSWGMAKKPYRLKLKDDFHFMGMPAKDNAWVLLANHADKTLMRNALAFEIGKACQMYYTPAYRYLDVVLNGKYIGNYMATDQVERNKKRVDLDKLTFEDTALPDISGGYLLEIDGFANSETDTTQEGNPIWFTGWGGYSSKVTVKYPDNDDMNHFQMDYISAHYSAFESAVKNFVVGVTDTSKLTKYLDFKSFARWYIAFELTANPDGIWSIYVKKNRNDDKFYFGPLWDNDISFGNCNRIYSVANDGRNESIMVKCFSNDYVKSMISKILSIPEVRRTICIEWYDIYPGLENKLLHVIDSLATTLDASQERNFSNSVWPVLGTVVYNELTPRYTYEAEVAFLRGYMDDRYDFVDQYIRSLVDDPKALFTPEPDRYYLLQCLNGKYLYAEPDGEGYRLAASTTFPADSASARFEVVMTKKYFQEAVYYLRNEAYNGFVYIDSVGQFIPLDAEKKTMFTLYDSPNDGSKSDNYFGLVSAQTPPALANLGLDANSSNSTNVVAWSTSNKKAQREYRFIDAGKLITALNRTVKEPQVNLAGKVFSGQGVLTLQQVPAGLRIRVYGLDGRLAATAMTEGYDTVLTLPAGVYIVVAGNERVKVMVR